MSDDKTLKPLPLPPFEVDRNNHIATDVKEKEDLVQISNPRVAAPGRMSVFSVDNNTIEKHTNSVERGKSSVYSAEDEFAEAYGHIGSLANIINVYQDPKAPIMFPQAEDAIKSLNFSAASKDSDVVTKVTRYYQMVIELMQGKITPDQYYSEMPALIEAIKDFTLNETDWETLRESILRVQRYIVNYMWEDMQLISRAMDTGFAEYQKQLNNWIKEANRYYSSEDFIPGGSIILDQFGRGANIFPRDKYEIQQNLRYLIDGMCVQISASKPDFVGTQVAGQPLEDRERYPSNKQMVWIEIEEEIAIV